MEINYWQCRFHQYKEHNSECDDERIPVFGCLNRKSETGWCELSNKCKDTLEDCKLIDFPAETLPEVQTGNTECPVFKNEVPLVLQFERCIKIWYQSRAYYVLPYNAHILDNVLNEYSKTNSLSVTQLMIMSQVVIDTNTNEFLKLRSSAQTLVDSYFNTETADGV